MEIAYRPETEALREEIRAFCRDEVPEEFKRAVRHESEIEGEDSRRWLHMLYRKGGWSAPGWSEEMGGPGWSYEQQYVFERELALNDAPRVPLFGAGMIGPAIIEFGTREMQEQFLPAILEGEILWCQGYSEPNSGSDLASLQTSAVRDGDHYVLNGTKMWTSDGHHADWMFGLFRTDSSGKKQHGITVLLVDMKTPGIELRPILTFDGGHETNQTFFDDVRVPVANRLGEEHRGWTVAKYILGLERFGTAEVSRSRASLARLKRLARDEPSSGGRLIDDEDFADAVAQVELELRALELTEQRFLFGPGGPDAMGAEASMLKIRGTEVQQRITELTMEALGHYAQAHVPEQLTEGYNDEPVGPTAAGYASRSYFNMRKTSIYSGSNEIQKNIIAKAVLGL